MGTVEQAGGEQRGNAGQKGEFFEHEKRLRRFRDRAWNASPPLGKSGPVRRRLLALPAIRQQRRGKCLAAALAASQKAAPLVANSRGQGVVLTLSRLRLSPFHENYLHRPQLRRPHCRAAQRRRPPRPVIFLKPETALLQRGQPFFIPEFSQRHSPRAGAGAAREQKRPPRRRALCPLPILTPSAWASTSRPVTCRAN